MKKCLLMFLLLAMLLCAACGRMPEAPTGPCMVSGEGACAAAYHYGRKLL